MEGGFDAHCDQGPDPNCQSLPESEFDACLRGIGHLPNRKNIHEYDCETKCDTVISDNLETKKHSKHAPGKPKEPSEGIIGEQIRSHHYETDPDAVTNRDLDA